jgi:hypothetical protein
VSCSRAIGEIQIQSIKDAFSPIGTVEWNALIDVATRALYSGSVYADTQFDMNEK